MAKKLQENALSFFLIMCGISLLFGMLWLKPVMDAHRLFINETRANMGVIMYRVEQTRVLVTELGYATAVMSMTEKGMIEPAEANQMIEASVNSIDAQSIRFGKLAKLLNEYRINQQQEQK